jgi:hypothetical protein
MKLVNFMVEGAIFILLLPVVVIWLIVAGTKYLKTKLDNDMSIENRLKLTDKYLKECSEYKLKN